MSTLILTKLKGAEIFPYLSDVAKLGIQLFKEYPYLLEEGLETQINFLKRYAECVEGVMVVVTDGGVVVGASTGMPFIFDSESYQKPFIDHGIDIQKVFYLGESFLLPAYHGKKIYRHFIAEREAAAIKGGCTMATFLSVERLPNDLRQPKGYMPLDNVWQHFGYEKHPELYVDSEWKEVGDKCASINRLVYWLKQL